MGFLKKAYPFDWNQHTSFLGAYPSIDPLKFRC